MTLRLALGDDGGVIECDGSTESDVVAGNERAGRDGNALVCNNGAGQGGDSTDGGRGADLTGTNRNRRWVGMVRQQSEALSICLSDHPSACLVTTINDTDAQQGGR